MLRQKIMLILLALLIIGTFGCSKNIIMNVDGMPVSNHEYHLQNYETGLRTVYLLTRYHRLYEGDEYRIVPEYMNALHEKNRIDPQKTEDFGLHVKVVNLKNKKFSYTWKITGPKGLHSSGLKYTGKLSRKDFYLPLPIDEPGEFEFRFSIGDANSNDLFDVPLMRYTVKGGEPKVVSHK